MLHGQLLLLYNVASSGIYAHYNKSLTAQLSLDQMANPLSRVTVSSCGRDTASMVTIAHHRFTKRILYRMLARFKRRFRWSICCTEYLTRPISLYFYVHFASSRLCYTGRSRP